MILDLVERCLYIIFRDLGEDAIVCNSIPHAIETISQTGLKDQVEGVWVIGGASVYKVKT